MHAIIPYLYPKNIFSSPESCQSRCGHSVLTQQDKNPLVQAQVDA